MAELHVTNGDHAAEAIAARLHVRLGGVLAWRDVLHEGPVPGGSDDELLEARVSFLAGMGWADHDEARIEFVQRDAALREAVDLATRVTLWFEDDLFDQLQLIQVLDRLHEHNGPIALVRMARPPRGDLAVRYGSARPLGERELALARRAWAAFRAPDPLGLQELLLSGTPGLPDLGPALRRHLEQFPATIDGLARTERQALQAIADGAHGAHALFAAATADDERPFMGDAPFLAWLDALAANPDPLIDAHHGRHALTAAGRRVLAGKADRAQLAGGIDRWHGGVHLHGPRPAWRWDRGSGRVVAAVE